MKIEIENPVLNAPGFFLLRFILLQSPRSGPNGQTIETPHLDKRYGAAGQAGNKAG